MTNSVSLSRPEKYNIAAFFSGVGVGWDLNRPTSSRVVYANEFDNMRVRLIV